ncbi:MAG: DUF4065 domain-containing protein [Clostridia bacterium]|nr:DUF4065 domain-containing protein [Clostridia bacterium]
MYDALTIARYIVNYSNKIDDVWLSNLKLQKLLYFCQAYFLLDKGLPCFRDTIEAWDFGPVVPAVYHEFKRFGAGWIPPVKQYYHKPDPKKPFDFVTMDFDETSIDKKTRKLVEDVVDNFKDYNNVALTTLAHGQEPWKRAFSSSMGNTITNESLVDYFSKD